MTDSLSINDLWRCIEHLQQDKPLVAPTMVVSPQMFPIVDRELNKVLLKKIGIHHQYEYKGEIWWDSYFVLRKKKPFTIESVMREDDGYYKTYNWFLPQAMKKRGYKVVEGKLVTPHKQEEER